MNWYKQAQFESKWKNLIAGFGIGTIIGLAATWGMGLLDLKKSYERNPQKVEQALQQIVPQQNIKKPPVPSIIKQSPPMIEQPSIKTKEKQISQGIDIAKMIERHEGKRNSVYVDTKGHPTIGIGFNLDKIDAKQKLSNLGININKILNGQSLTDEQVYILFKEDLENAIIDAHKFLSNFDQQPIEIQTVLIDMSFNLGYTRLSNFKNFREALLNKNYQLAADEMVNSKWYNQVGNRSKELESIVRGLK